MSNQTLEQLAIENNIHQPTLERFMEQVRMELSKIDISEMNKEEVSVLISNTIDGRHKRNLAIIEDCLAHPAEAAALVFSLT